MLFSNDTAHPCRRSGRSSFATKEKATTLRTVLTGASVSAFETAHVVFLLAANLEHGARVAVVAETINKKGWTPEFFAAARYMEHTD